VTPTPDAGGASVAQTSAFEVCGFPKEEPRTPKRASVLPARQGLIMHVEYVFLLKSQVNLGLGDWEPLSFQRNGFQVRIPKPISDTSIYLKTQPNTGPVELDISRSRPGSALRLQTTMVSIQMESSLQVPEDKISHTFEPVAVEIFNHFKSWVRVLTRQHWIGYQWSAFSQQDFNVNVITGEVKKPLSIGGVVVGFDYWKRLDQPTWSTSARSWRRVDCQVLDSCFSATA